MIHNIERDLLHRIGSHITVAFSAISPDRMTPVVANIVGDDVRATISKALEKASDETSSAFRLLADFMSNPPAEPPVKPIPMRIHCPLCGKQHIDDERFATEPHTSHTCQNPTCGLTWKVANVPTVGVRFLPGTNNEDERTP